VQARPTTPFFAKKAYRFAAGRVKTILPIAEHRLRNFSMRNRVTPLISAALLLVLATLSAAAEATYVIKEGETLFAISRRSGVPVDVLISFNGIPDVSRLKIGTVIRIPAAYTVVKGDTLYALSKRWSVPVERILSLNGLNQDSLIKPGQKLYMPAGTATASAAASPSPASIPLPAASALPVVWPHAGTHTTEKGKLWWMIFQGSSGDIVRSATEGEVKWAATWWGYGKVVIVKTPDGRSLVYGGNRELLVKVGERVFPGTEIARLGESLPGGGTKLYFGVNDAAGKSEDPERFFSAQSQS
jgi:murein DD-endopeptidase MepM/ murein hydrolase activator NlpD